MEIMDINTFAKALADELNKLGHEIEVKEMAKNNEMLHGLVFADLKPVAPTVYAEDYYKDDIDIAAIAAEIDYMVGNKRIAKPAFNASEIGTKEYVLANVTARLANPDGNEAFFNDLVSYPSEFEGLSAYFAVSVYANDEAVGSYKLTKSHLENLGLTLEEVKDAAEKNMQAQIFSLKEFFELRISLLKQIAEEEGDTLNVDSMMGTPLWVITNPEFNNGNGVVLKEETLKKVQEALKSERFILLPSSVHEWLATPILEDMTQKDYANIVKEVNHCGSVTTQEKVVDAAYLYEAGKITKIEAA